MFEEFNSSEIENEMLERFGDRFLEETMRMIQTRTYVGEDEPLIHEALCIVLAIYTRKLKDGEINKGKVLH